RMLFLDITGGVKPYLLTDIDNHMGASTRVRYASSTSFYVDDERRYGRRWKTPLPMPVQVVARVEQFDVFSQTSLTTEYRYHHGYWDGVEREFRGFGMVETLDTTATGAEVGVPAAGVDPSAAFAPPTLTKTWFHSGPVDDESGGWDERDLSDEFWPEDPQALGQTRTVKAFLRTLPNRPARRDALRALRGSILRTELYALDATTLRDR